MSRLEYLEIDGKKINKCPICSGPCTISSWQKNKMCVDCKRLIDKGHTREEVKRLRSSQESTEAVLEEPTIKLLDSIPDYNFKNTFPAGVYIFLSSGDEASESKYLREIYVGLYREYGTIGNFDNLIANILQLKLELYRNSKQLAKQINPVEKKGIQESNVKLSNQINLDIKVLEDIKANFGSQSMNVVTTEFAHMLKYHHENDQEYTGIGICPDCKQRLFFKTNFSTFKTYYVQELINLRDSMVVKDEFDMKTISYLIKNIEKILDDNALVDTYIIRHVRELEAALQ